MDDVFFGGREPGGVHGVGGHEEEGNKAEASGDASLDNEDPSRIEFTYTD